MKITTTPYTPDGHMGEIKMYKQLEQLTNEGYNLTEGAFQRPGRKCAECLSGVYKARKPLRKTFKRQEVSFHGFM